MEKTWASYLKYLWSYWLRKPCLLKCIKRSCFWKPFRSERVKNECYHDRREEKMSGHSSNERYLNKLYYTTVLYYCGDSHWRYSGLNFVSFTFLKLITGKHLCWSLIFSISCRSACNFIKKEALTQVFSCEFCKISKNIFFYRTP